MIDSYHMIALIFFTTLRNSADWPDCDPVNAHSTAGFAVNFWQAVSRLKNNFRVSQGAPRLMFDTDVPG